MTVSTTPTRDFTRDQILKAAIRLCGILGPGKDPKPAQYADAAVHFDLITQSLQADGLIQQSIERRTLAITSGTAEYTLPSEIIDIELAQDDTIATVIDSTANVETLVKTMSREEYLPLAVKTNSGKPSRAYLEKQATVKLVLWPVPDANYTLRYDGVRLLRGGSDGGVTLDLRRTWSLYYVYAIAKNVAMDNSLYERAQNLSTLADQELQKCKAGDSEHGDLIFRVGHRGRNW